MDSKSVWGWILIGVLVLIAINVLRSVLAFLGGVVYFAIHVAIIVGIIWLLFNLLGRRQTF